MENSDTAYALGQSAFDQGLRSSDNPYEASDQRCQAWDAGYEAAKAYGKSTRGFAHTDGFGFIEDSEGSGVPD